MLCVEMRGPLTGAVPCAPLRSLDPGTSWKTPGRTCPREQPSPPVRIKTQWLRGRGPQLGCAVLCPVAPSCPTLRDPMDCSPAKLLCLWDFSGKNTGVGCHFLLQGIFPTQGWNLHLLRFLSKSLL